MRAPAALVYQAFASAEAMTAWLPPDGIRGEMLAFSFHEGGAYRMRLIYLEPNGALGKTSADADEADVRFTRLVPGERIEQAVTFESDDAAFAGEMRITWTLDPVEGGTLVTVRCEDVPAGIRQADHLAGLNGSLSNLAAFVEQMRHASGPGIIHDQADQ